MYSIKLATIFQVVLLLLALGIITFYYIMGCVGIGLHGNVSFENLVNAYKYAAIFIASLLILSLLFRNYNIVIRFWIGYICCFLDHWNIH